MLWKIFPIRPAWNSVRTRPMRCIQFRKKFPRYAFLIWIFPLWISNQRENVCTHRFEMKWCDIDQSTTKWECCDMSKQTYRKSSSCRKNSVWFSLFDCTPSINCLPNMSSTSMGTMRSGNSGRLFKASLVTAKRDDKFDLNVKAKKPNKVCCIHEIQSCSSKQC